MVIRISRVLEGIFPLLWKKEKEACGVFFWCQHYACRRTHFNCLAGTRKIPTFLWSYFLIFTEYKIGNWTRRVTALHALDN